MKSEQKLPLNLQFFAEPAPALTPEPVPEPTPAPEPTPTPQLTAEEQLAQLTVQLEKERKAREKACSEAADFKKKYNATLDEKQKAALEKAEQEAEREEKFNQLLKENTITKFEKNYTLLGYPEDLANKAATAQFDNDTDTLFKIQQQFQAGLLKTKEAEWMKSNPIPNAGNGEGGAKDPFLDGFNQ